jgi:hypothetical protein
MAAMLTSAMLSVDGVRFVLNRIRERLWVRPLLVCLLAFAATVGAKLMTGPSSVRWRRRSLRRPSRP